jgi:AraC-like DNA-binding protein
MEISTSIPLQLQNPSDPRASKVAQTLLANPSDRRCLEELCRGSGASKRTVERIFQQETQMTFGKWRQQLRLMQALRLLAAGEKISHLALEAGYSTPSAFTAMFRKLLGTTPGRYFQ